MCGRTFEITGAITVRSHDTYEKLGGLCFHNGLLVSIQLGWIKYEIVEKFTTKRKQKILQYIHKLKRYIRESEMNSSKDFYFVKRNVLMFVLVRSLIVKRLIYMRKYPIE